MVEEALGDATIVYDDPGGGVVEKAVQNKHLAYFQDHWIVRVEASEKGDVVRRIPKERVHYVERTVDEFREEVNTLTNQVESFAEDLRDRFLGGLTREDDGPHHIDVESGSADDGIDDR
jgi:hypothetical protein